jgi:pilus assembly protein Flp/PilA
VNAFVLNFFVPYLSGLVTSVREEEGQGLAEYALILAFIAIVAIAALTFLGSDISSLLSKVATSF